MYQVAAGKPGYYLMRRHLHKPELDSELDSAAKPMLGLSFRIGVLEEY